MSAEPPRAVPPCGAGARADTAAGFASRTLPLLGALDAVMAEDAAGLAEVLAVAEAQRPGTTLALAAALAVEAEHLRELARRTEAAVARLRRVEAGGRPHP